MDRLARENPERLDALLILSPQELHEGHASPARPLNGLAMAAIAYDLIPFLYQERYLTCEVYAPRLLSQPRTPPPLRHPAGHLRRDVRRLPRDARRPRAPGREHRRGVRRLGVRPRSFGADAPRRPRGPARIGDRRAVRLQPDERGLSQEPPRPDRRLRPPAARGPPLPPARADLFRPPRRRGDDPRSRGQARRGRPARADGLVSPTRPCASCTGVARRSRSRRCTRGSACRSWRRCIAARRWSRGTTRRRSRSSATPGCWPTWVTRPTSPRSSPGS